MAKLVRDRIPEIIQKKEGKAPHVTIASDAEYPKYIKKKLQEEVTEFAQSESIEELADILEVIDAWIDCKQIKKEELLQVQEKKRRERGGFSQRYVLEK